MIDVPLEDHVFPLTSGGSYTTWWVPSCDVGVYTKKEMAWGHQSLVSSLPRNPQLSSPSNPDLGVSGLARLGLDLSRSHIRFWGGGRASGLYLETPLVRHWYSFHKYMLYYSKTRTPPSDPSLFSFFFRSPDVVDRRP